MNRDEVLEQLAPLASTTVRRADGGGKVMVAETDAGFAIRPQHRAHALELAPEGFVGLLGFSGIGESLAKRLTPATLASVATEAVAGRTNGGEYSLLVRDNMVVDFAPAGQHRNVSAERVVANIERGIADDAEFSRVMTLPKHTVQLETIGAAEAPVRKGDLVRGGTMTQFSPLGITRPVIKAFNVRLICTNGMTTTDVEREFRFLGGRGGAGEGDDIWQWFRRSTRDAYASFGGAVDRYRQMAETQIAPQDRGMMLEALLRDGGIRGEIAEAVRNDAITNPPENEWELVNLLTAATSHLIQDGRAVVKAQVAAAGFADVQEHRRTCPTCRRDR